jgi:hypothetical protein
VRIHDFGSATMAEPGAERLPELVAQIGGQPSNPDERLVDEDEIADGDGFGTTRSRRRRKPNSQHQSDHCECARDSAAASGHVHVRENSPTDAKLSRYFCRVTTSE